MMDPAFDPGTIVQGIVVPLLFIVGVAVAMTEAVKSFGVQGKAAQATSIAIGAVLGAYYWLAAFGMPGALSEWFMGTIITLIAGLSPSGFYDLTSKR